MARRSLHALDRVALAVAFALVRRGSRSRSAPGLSSSAAQEARLGQRVLWSVDWLVWGASWSWEDWLVPWSGDWLALAA